jgi:cobalt-zinc-cadmium efflux system membrane fusion protein
MKKTRNKLFHNFRQWIFTSAACLIVVAGCTSHAAEPRGETSAANEALLTEAQVNDSQLRMETVDEREVGTTVETTGRVAFADLHVSHVFSPVSGRVANIVAQPGQRVVQGSPLATIVSPDLGSAFADLEKADADLTAGRRELGRQKELFDAHAASRRDYEAAENNYEKARAEMDRARQKARLLKGGSANNVTQEYTLRALIGGEVIARNVNPGVEVQGQYASGTAVELFTIGELDPIWVIADVFEIDLPRVKKGAPVSVKVLAYPGRVFEGTVDWVSGTLDPATRTAKIRCTLANPDRELKPEMYATVSVGVSGQKSLAVPRSALLQLADQTVVFVNVGKTSSGQVRFERRIVAVDQDDGAEYVAVKRGLSRGDRVVARGAILLSGMI